MKLLQNIAAASCLIFLSGMNASAQETIKVDDPWEDYPSKKALYNDYSRWSIGINGGVPFFAGDFRSVTKGNGYWGGMVGLQGGYQFNPLFGIRLLWTMPPTKPVREIMKTTSSSCRMRKPITM